MEGSNAVLDCYDILGGTNLADFRWIHWEGLPPEKSIIKFVVDAPSLLKIVNGTLIESVHYNTTSIVANDVHYGVSLILKNVTQKDAGWYSCLVCNHIGCTIASATLKVTDATSMFMLFYFSYKLRYCNDFGNHPCMSCVQSR